jgi:ATP-dependent RNA helicase DHX37/DHR1
MLTVGHSKGCLPYAIALIAGLSIQNPFVPENQVIGTLKSAEIGIESGLEDVASENAQNAQRKAYNRVHREFSMVDQNSDAIKLLAAVASYARQPPFDGDRWCKEHFLVSKSIKETTALRKQLTYIIQASFPTHGISNFDAKLPNPTKEQVTALKQMVAVGFIDQIAMRADCLPNPPELRKPKRAIDVPYQTLFPSHQHKHDSEESEKFVYIHPSSILARLSASETPKYIIYSHLQRATPTIRITEDGGMVTKVPKTRMHALTDIGERILAAVTKGTGMVTYSKPIGKAPTMFTQEGIEKRRYFAVPTLGQKGGLGWPLAAQEVVERKENGVWVIE